MSSGSDTNRAQLESENAALRDEITQLQQQLAASQAQLNEQRHLLQTVIDHLNDDIFIKDLDCRFVLGNKATMNTLRVTSTEEFIGKSDYDFWDDQAAADKYTTIDRGIMESGEAVMDQIFGDVNPDGIMMWASSSKIPLYDTSGAVSGLLCINRNITAEKQAEQHVAELQAKAEEQQEMLREVSTPVIPLMGGIIVIPLVGSIDSQRAVNITRAILAGISQHDAKTVILDITGVPIVDSGVASYLNKTIQAARLKGARAIITGIAEAVAETIVDLGIDWSELDTLSDLQTGLTTALEEGGYRIYRK